MRKSQSYLTKKFKGRYIQKLIDFLFGLDSNWKWEVVYFFTSLNNADNVIYCKIFCEEANKLVLIKCDLIEKRIGLNSYKVNLLVRKVAERNHLKENPEIHNVTQIFQEEKML